jgi:hypothetical protein
MQLILHFSNFIYKSQNNEYYLFKTRLRANEDSAFALNEVGEVSFA